MIATCLLRDFESDNRQHSNLLITHSLNHQYFANCTPISAASCLPKLAVRGPLRCAAVQSSRVTAACLGTNIGKHTASSSIAGGGKESGVHAKIRQARVTKAGIEALLPGEVIRDTDLAGCGARRRTGLPSISCRSTSAPASLGSPSGSPWTPETARK